MKLKLKNGEEFTGIFINEYTDRIIFFDTVDEIIRQIEKFNVLSWSL